jgi:putative endonuclease
MFNSRQNLGQDGEHIAVEYLAKDGYRILTRNFRCRYGEIDIIAQKREVLVFIEVKTRTGKTCGSPAAAVTQKKQRQISRTAQYYLAEHSLFDTPARFDVVAIVIDPGQHPLVEIIESAFDLCEA